MNITPSALNGNSPIYHNRPKDNVKIMKANPC